MKMITMFVLLGGLSLSLYAGEVVDQDQWSTGKGASVFTKRPTDGEQLVQIDVEGNAAENLLNNHPGVKVLNGKRFLSGAYKVNLVCLEGYEIPEMKKNVPPACTIIYTPNKPDGE